MLPLIFPGLIFLLIPLLVALNRNGLQQVAELFCWTGPVLLFVVIPLLDWVVGRREDIPSPEVVRRLEASRHYRWTLFAFVPIQLAAVLAGAFIFVSTDLTFLGFEGSLSVPAKIGIAVSMGIVSGLGINVGHELGHSRSGVDFWLARAALAPSFYGHFPVAHNFGHHALVATSEDPSSARIGETVWRFLPRTIIGSYRNSWRLESSRLSRAGHGPWHPGNLVLQSLLTSLALWTLPVAIFGHRVLPFILAQAVGGIVLLESVNYLEHYGLLRKKNSRGRYEPCRPEHSWNSDHLVTSFLLFNLQRHSDHHAFPDKPYQTLQSRPDAPQLPSGYATMIMLAWIPPLWRRVMDHRVIGHYGGDVNRANWQPSCRPRGVVAAAG